MGVMPSLACSLPRGWWLSRVEIEIGDRFGRNAMKAGLFALTTTALEPVWSADGRRLLYESGAAPREISGRLTPTAPTCIA